MPGFGTPLPEVKLINHEAQAGATEGTPVPFSVCSVVEIRL
jgi:hypothetical protein